MIDFLYILATVAMITFFVLQIGIAAHLLLLDRKKSKQPPPDIKIQEELLHDTGSGRLWLERLIFDDE